jgi:hypothetical protein
MMNENFSYLQTVINTVLVSSSLSGKRLSTYWWTLFFISPFIFMGCKEKKLVEKYKNGSRFVCEMKDGRKNGLGYSYDSLGRLEIKSNWKNDTLNGTFIVYYPVDKNDSEKEPPVSREMFYLNGEAHGVTKWYYQDGTLQSLLNYNNGIKEGTQTIYYKDGKVATIHNWKTVKNYGKEITIPQPSINFDLDGNIIDQWHFVIVRAEKDTVKMGETFKLKIKLINPVNEKISFITGTFNELFRTIDDKNIDTLKSDNFEINYSEVAKKPGVNVVRGIVEDYKTRKNAKGGTNKETTPYFLKHTFFVESN